MTTPVGSVAITVDMTTMTPAMMTMMTIMMIMTLIMMIITMIIITTTTTTTTTMMMMMMMMMMKRPRLREPTIQRLEDGSELGSTPSETLFVAHFMLNMLTTCLTTEIRSRISRAIYRPLNSVSTRPIAFACAAELRMRVVWRGVAWPRGVDFREATAPYFQCGNGESRGRQHDIAGTETMINSHRPGLACGLFLYYMFIAMLSSSINYLFYKHYSSSYYYYDK